MAQRVTLRKRQPYNTTSNRTRVVKTPGGKLVVHHLKKLAVSWMMRFGRATSSRQQQRQRRAVAIRMVVKSSSGSEEIKECFGGEVK